MHALHKILTGKKVNKQTRLIVAPSSQEVFAKALEEGIIATLSDAGAMQLIPPALGRVLATIPAF